MIDLRNVAVAEVCPACGAPLEAYDWYMPGMRLLARARCTGCARDWFVDLPAGQGLYSPMMLDPASGAVFDRAGVPWFADWLRDSYRTRTAQAPVVQIDRRAGTTRPVVLINCLDTLYGHALLKLLNAQQYLDAGGFDVVLIVQPMLLPLIPDGVAEVWAVDLPLREGTAWSDGLANAIRRESERFARLWLAPVYPHIHPTAFAIERFSRVRPFVLTEWDANPVRKVTFIWRDDRIWSPAIGLGRSSQKRAVTALFEKLRLLLPALDPAVAGIGMAGGLPDWIEDMRVSRPDAPTERAWLQRYAASHAVIGVHGSNMLLPSAHAGSLFELLPEGRDGNFLQDIIFNGSEPRDLFFRYRFLPEATTPPRLAALVALVASRYPDFDRLMAPDMTVDPDVRD